MVDSVKISQLPDAVTPLTGAEVAPLVQSGVTTKASVADVVRVVPTSILPNGMFVPASNTLAFSTDTTERMRIDPTGNVGIGTTSPSAKLNIVDSSSSDALRITQTGAGNALVVEDTANPDSTPFVVNADGVVVVGAQVPYNTVTVYGTSITPAVNVVGGTFGGAAASISNWSSSGINLPSLVFSKSKSGTIGSQGVVANGDDLGAMSFTGSDGAKFVNAAAIRAQVDGTPGTNDMPGRLTFSTTADGASSPTERMRIDSSGNVGIGAASPTSRLTVAGPASFQAPSTIVTNYSMTATDSSLIFNGAGSITLTLQAASSYTGRILYVKTIAAQTVVSASSNVVPVNSATAGTAILAAVAGRWAVLQSDGTNWVIMAAN